MPDWGWLVIAVAAWLVVLGVLFRLWLAHEFRGVGEDGE